MTIAPLAPCPSCSRHVRINVSECPFCASAIAIAPESVVPAAPSISMTRAAVFTFATTLALGCATTATPPPEPAPTVTPAPTPMATEPVMTPQDQGAPATIYGAPVPMEPMDAGAPATPDAGAAVPAVDVPVTPPTPPAHPTHPVRPTPPAVHPGGPVVRYGSPPRPDDA